MLDKVKSIIDALSKLGGSHLSFLKGAFSDKGTPSMSRLMTVPAAFASIFALLWHVVHNGKMPSYYESLGLATFGTAHYAVNRATTAWGKNPETPPPPPEPKKPDDDKDKPNA